MPDPLHDLGRLRPVIDQIAETPDFISFLRVRDCDERFVIAVNIRDDYQFHLRVLQADSRQSSLSSHQLLVSSVIHIFN